MRPLLSSKRTHQSEVFFICLIFSSLSFAINPEQPVAVRGFLGNDAKCFTLLWEPVDKDTAGDLIASPVRYDVYRRSTIFGPEEKVNVNRLSVPVFADRVDGQVFFYSVRAVDETGNGSIPSLSVDSSAEANIIFISEDHSSSLIIPGSSAWPLYAYSNSLGVHLKIVQIEDDLPDNANVIRCLRFQLRRADNNQDVSSMLFDKGDVSIEVNLSMFNGNVARGAPSASSAVNVTSVKPENLSYYWFNGNSWIKIGGTYDSAAQSIKINSHHLGQFQIQATSPADSLTLNKANVYPSLFTPNGDGRNDRVYFVLENPNHVDITGLITDLSGRTVATLPSPVSLSGPETTLIWDGKDSSGAAVTNGIYIYQLKGEGKHISGSVAVAK